MYDFHHHPHVKEQHRSKKTLWITLYLTTFFTIVEIVGGIVSNSLALLSDSAHMISDVVALGLSMAAIYMATREPTKKYTFGFLRFEIIASFLNGLALCIIALGIFYEGIMRFITPQHLDFKLMLIIASIGLVVNIVLTIVLSRSIGEEENLNVKSALWHFIGDLMSSIGVIIAGTIIYFTGQYFVDPLISMVIGTIIFIGGYKITKESIHILMEATPEQFDLDEIRADIAAVEGVEDVHEMHLWSVSTEHYSLMVHVLVETDIQPYCVIIAITDLMHEKYGIDHINVQVENLAIQPHGEYGKLFKQKKAIQN
jgi:cobalt-zinc-cadmium efflux system protein